MGKYYAVYGKNGLGVFTEYFAVLKVKQYLSHFNCRKCDVRYEAETIAVTEYNKLQNYPGSKIFTGSLEKNNWVYYPHNMQERIVPIVKM